MRERFATADVNRKSRQTIALECNYLLAAVAHCCGSAPGAASNRRFHVTSLNYRVFPDYKGGLARAFFVLQRA
jgi:hypothetical protein